MTVDISKWSGEGAFTQVLVDRLQLLDAVAEIRVEDAPASRSDADYNFVSNEIFVVFATTVTTERVKRFGFLPSTREVAVKAMTVTGLETALTIDVEVGSPDYADEAMLQYLRTERVIPPYQTRGYKLVELVRIYDASAARAEAPTPPNQS